MNLIFFMNLIRKNYKYYNDGYLISFYQIKIKVMLCVLQIFILFIWMFCLKKNDFIFVYNLIKFQLIYNFCNDRNILSIVEECRLVII